MDVAVKALKFCKKMCFSADRTACGHYHKGNIKVLALSVPGNTSVIV